MIRQFYILLKKEAIKKRLIRKLDYHKII